MGEVVENVKVTIPELDIERKRADVVEKAPKRFSVWWDARLHDARSTPYADPDVNVPNEMIILSY